MIKRVIFESDKHQIKISDISKGSIVIFKNKKDGEAYLLVQGTAFGKYEYGFVSMNSSSYHYGGSHSSIQEAILNVKDYGHVFVLDNIKELREFL